MTAFSEQLWYGNHPLKWLLMPLSWGYGLVSQLRRKFLQRFCQIPCPVPILVVGNLTVGGVGKTPLVIELAKKIQEKGLSVGIVSRGYGSLLNHYPYEVQAHDCPKVVGDEPLMMAQKTNCPVVIAPKRSEAVDYLMTKHQVQIIVSDDGLQHYKMGRAIEIAVIDGTRGLGNGCCLPAGPLREPKKRLEAVDFIVVNEGIWPGAYPMTLKPGMLTKLSSDEKVSIDALNGSVAAVAGIGNPKRFYLTLSKLGIEFSPYPFPDHHLFQARDLEFKESFILMTEKDAVKCRAFSSDAMFYLPVHAQLNHAFWQALWSHQHLKGLSAYGTD